MSTGLPKVKCLLVDDLEENLLALSALLRRDDVEILTARTGAEALELLLVHDVALAFLDVQMPDMDGFELAELMRGSERTRHVPLIFVTAGARDQHRLFKGYESGAVDFLYKPIEPNILRNKAEVFFQLHRQKLQLAEELKVRTETLRLNEMFTAVLGHDLRNPLNAIVTSAHVLQRVAADDTAREAAGRILSSSNRMRRLIEDVLDLARARLAGGITLKLAAVDLGTLVQRVVREHQAAHPSQRIEMIATGDLNCTLDGERLAQLASNLIGNALQHGKTSEPVEMQVDGSRPLSVTLSVTNAGEIPAEILPNVFDPFRGGQRHLARNEGLGLGLYIVQQIVVAHQGTVEVLNGDIGRVTFKVTVPRHVRL
jgi:two-component system, sensor histidine kinase and response regulator